MAHLNLAQHFVAEISEFIARGQVLQVRPVFRFDLRNIQTMRVRVVEKIPLQTPGLMVHLRPGAARIEHGHHAVIVHGLARIGVG